MSKSFKQVSTGLTLVCNREDVIKQYEKYPDFYIPLDGKSAAKKTEKSQPSPKTEEKPVEDKKSEDKAETPEKK